MNVLMIIFMVIASIFALGSIGYVTADVVIEIRAKEEAKEKKNEPAVVASQEEPSIELEPEPEPEPEPEIVESEPVMIPEDMPEPISAEIGLEVIDVAWPESMAKNKIYKYDPNGETLKRGDVVLVPTFDRHRHGDIFRTATVINGNYRVDSFPSDVVLKKIVRVVSSD